ncbi:NAD(P)/FAD-dependent oxidoreductase [Legionella sp. W05-934-2]|uniref:NAD(P)/FAD-dependent oxidoreductase n=1 Tax=Legionella sp. W05-934-2 TaxID=1198649 RepID=UPI0034635062
MDKFDVVIIGAGAAGLMCAIEAGKRGRRVLVLDQSNKVGKKILMSGGGRCNFTNYDIDPDKYISRNPHFCKSALNRYTQWDFIHLVERHHIAYYEKTLGQLFCQNKASDIVNMLLNECERANVTIQLQQTIKKITQTSDGFTLSTSNQMIQATSCVIATGGLSIPTMGSSPFGYQVAEQFGIPVHPTRAGLVPFTLQPHDKEIFADLAGISLDCIVSCRGQSFREQMLFTHRGLSGPAMLQISSYWQPGDNLTITLLPDIDWSMEMDKLCTYHREVAVKNAFCDYFPKRVVLTLLPVHLLEKAIKQLTPTDWQTIIAHLSQWIIKPNGTEGYRTAEVTLGGVDCDALSSKTFAAHTIPNLYFIGEVVDVTGWLGGYNFQWAWSSGWAAGQYV